MCGGRDADDGPQESAAVARKHPELAARAICGPARWSPTVGGSSAPASAERRSCTGIADGTLPSHAITLDHPSMAEPAQAGRSTGNRSHRHEGSTNTFNARDPWALWGVSLLVAAAVDGERAKPDLRIGTDDRRLSVARVRRPQRRHRLTALGSLAWLPSTGRILFVIEGGGESHPAYLDATGCTRSRRCPTPRLRRPPGRRRTRASLTVSGTTFATSSAWDRRWPPRRIDVRRCRPGASCDRRRMDRRSPKPTWSMPPRHQAPVARVRMARYTGPRSAGKGGVDGGDTAPAFSPDGRWVAFERVVDFDAGKGGLFVIRTAGVPYGASRTTGWCRVSRWSPDGKRILFTQELEPTTLRRRVDLGGRRHRRQADGRPIQRSRMVLQSPTVAGRAADRLDYCRPNAGPPELRVVSERDPFVDTVCRRRRVAGWA